MTDHAAQAHSFGPAAEVYEHGRPGYPDDALDWLLPAGRPRVVDLGAGTGKLTRQIRARGLEVTAVDPSDGMLARLRRAVPGVPALRGSAEAIPLADACADAVLVAQAWHWVDPARALPEAARVLTPGGRLGLVWNVRDESAGWVRRLGEILNDRGRAYPTAGGGPSGPAASGPRERPTAEEPSGTTTRGSLERTLADEPSGTTTTGEPLGDTTADEPFKPTTVGEPFGPAETATFSWTQRIGPERLVDLVASRSTIILLPPDQRAAVLSEVRRLIATHPGLVGRTEFELPYITHCVRASLPAG